MWPADRIVFLNDVYFCARDTIRLLQHDGDMVCGLDFDRPKLEEMPGEVTCFSGRSIGCAIDLAIGDLRQNFQAFIPGSMNCSGSKGDKLSPFGAFPSGVSEMDI